MPIMVPDDGSLDAPLALIGEAPASHEVAQKRPFVGPAGYRLREWMDEMGLSRKDAYWTNVYPYQAPSNKIAKVSHGDLAPWISDLHTRLARLRGPVVLVPMGDTAVRALLGRRLTITKARGSIFTYRDQLGRDHKVIPTLHPAATFYAPTLERRCRLDWRRIAGDLAFPTELRLPQREHFIKPTLSDLRWWLSECAARATVLAVDIETPRRLALETVEGRRKKDGTLGKSRTRRVLGAPRITCIGYSFDPAFSMTVPTTEEYWGDDLDAAWALIHELHALACAKAAQNHGFDHYWLSLPEYAAPLRAMRWDTRWMHHALDPLDSHSLAYMASVDTREPYWKDDAKDGGDLDSEWSDWETFQRYCGKDAAVTRELADTYASRLTAEGRREFYFKHYHALFGPMLRMSLRGLRLDPAAREAASASFDFQCRLLNIRLSEIAGVPLYGAKGSLSTKRLADYLYGALKLPVQKDRSTKATTTKEVVVRKLMLRFPNKLGSVYEAQAIEDTDTPRAFFKSVQAAQQAGPLILAHRRRSKLGSFVREGIADADGYVHTQYGFTETLRFTSGKNPRRTGANLQNVDRALRNVYVPEPGCFFLEVDASQGEDRIVKCLTGSERLIERARMAPWQNDEHARAAAVIWPDLPITPFRRYIGKRGRHAGNYGLMGLRLAEELLKDGVVVTPEEAQGYIDVIIDQDTPEVRTWQQRVRGLVMRDRSITNSWGQIWDFRWDRLSDDVYRQAYACVPQSELVNLLNHQGLVPLDKWLRATSMQTVLHHQNHDSLLMSTVADEAYDVAVFLHEHLTKPRVYGGVKLSMPMEFKAGLDWSLPLAWKRLPSREDFNADVAKLLKSSAA